MRSLRIGRKAEHEPRTSKSQAGSMKSRIFLPSKGQIGFGFRRIAKPRTCFAVCCVRSADIFKREGIEGLEKIPGVGASIARSIRDILLHGRLAMLDRLRGESEAIAVLASGAWRWKKICATLP